jgi:hypothetical protein
MAQWSDHGQASIFTRFGVIPLQLQGFRKHVSERRGLTAGWRMTGMDTRFPPRRNNPVKAKGHRGDINASESAKRHADRTRCDPYGNGLVLRGS